MSYDIQEVTVADARPTFLYQFATGAVVTRFISGPEDRTIDGNLWTASPISHEIIEQTGNVERNDLAISFPLNDTFAFGMLTPTYEVTTITIFRTHYNDLTEELRQYWKGRVVGTTNNEQTINVKTENVFTSMRRTGCRVRVLRSCRHDLYGDGCTLSRAAHEIAMVATAQSGVTLTVPLASDPLYVGKLAYGIVNWNGIFSLIEVHAGTSISLVVEIQGLGQAIIDDGPQDILVAVGCNRSHPRCVELENWLNFGGFHHMPDRNPFDSSIE